MFGARLLSSKVLSTSASTIRLLYHLFLFYQTQNCFLYDIHVLGLHLLRLFGPDKDYRICRRIILHHPPKIHMAAPSATAMASVENQKYPQSHIGHQPFRLGPPACLLEASLYARAVSIQHLYKPPIPKPLRLPQHKFFPCLLGGFSGIRAALRQLLSLLRYPHPILAL
jgi:hypothetical protein